MKRWSRELFPVKEEKWTCYQERLKRELGVSIRDGRGRGKIKSREDEANNADGDERHIELGLKLRGDRRSNRKRGCRG